MPPAAKKQQTVAQLINAAMVSSSRVTKAVNQAHERRLSGLDAPRPGIHRQTNRLNGRTEKRT
jgi:hypothetical protein